MPIDQHLRVLFTAATVAAMVTPGPDMLFVLGAILSALEFAVDGAVGVLAGRIGRWLRRRRAARRRIDVATGGIFIGLGLRLAVDR